MKRIIRVVIAICLIGMLACLLACFGFFAWNIWTFHEEYRVALSSVASTNKSEAEQMINHLESILAIQEDGLKNNLMSFVYGVLSTVLVGLCAGFVEKSRKSASESSSASQEAKQTTDEAKKAVQNAENDIVEANRQLEIVKREAKGLSEKRKEIEKELKEISAQFHLFRVRMDIVFASSVLKDEKIAVDETNNPVRIVLDDARELKNASLSSPHYLQYSQLCKELDGFKHSIDEFEQNAGPNEIVNRRNAANNYRRWIDEAIEICNQIPRNPSP